MEKNLAKGAGREADGGDMLLIDPGELETSRGVVGGTDEKGRGLARIENTDLAVLARESEVGP